MDYDTVIGFIIFGLLGLFIFSSGYYSGLIKGRMERRD